MRYALDLPPTQDAIVTTWMTWTIFSIGNSNLNLHPSDCEPGGLGGALLRHQQNPTVWPCWFGKKKWWKLGTFKWEKIHLHTATACELVFFFYQRPPQFPKKQHVFLGKGIPFNQQILWEGHFSFGQKRRHNFTSRQDMGITDSKDKKVTAGFTWQSCTVGRPKQPVI